MEIHDSCLSSTCLPSPSRLLHTTLPLQVRLMGNHGKDVLIFVLICSSASRPADTVSTVLSPVPASSCCL